MEDIKKVAEGKIEYTQSLTLKNIEDLWISESYEFFNHCIAATSKALGIGRSTLYRRLEDIDAANKE